MILTTQPDHLHTLPLPLWVLLVVTVIAVVVAVPAYLRESTRSVAAHAAARPSCPVHGDTVACPCQLAPIEFASRDLDTL